ncbi:MAG TPA: GIY-YIG nuclease family protein [Planctomycetota bacterium]|nr:GIY-YIG nuclease family protein [Planctomycetota bacterium]
MSRKIPAWHVYLLRCSDGSLYCGITNKLKLRIAAHNCGKGAKYTRSRWPVTLAWSRRCKSKSDALKLEYRIKQMAKTEKEQLAARIASRRKLRHALHS